MMTGRLASIVCLTLMLSAKSSLAQDNAKPTLLALTWQADDRASQSQTPLWNSVGERLTPDERNAIDSELDYRSQLVRLQKDQSRPLVVIFELHDGLPVDTTGVRTIALLAQGDEARHGSWGDRFSGSKTPSRIFAVATAASTRPAFEWPKQVDLKLKFPVEEPVLLKTITEIPKERFEFGRGASWAVEPNVSYNNRKDGWSKPGGVLMTSRSTTDLLVHSVVIYGKDGQPVSNLLSTIREVDGEKFTTRVSKPFPPPEELDRVEFYRQRFRRSIIRNVAVRTDLLP